MRVPFSASNTALDLDPVKHPSDFLLAQFGREWQAAMRAGAERCPTGYPSLPNHKNPDGGVGRGAAQRAASFSSCASAQPCRVPDTAHSDDRAVRPGQVELASGRTKIPLATYFNATTLKCYNFTPNACIKVSLLFPFKNIEINKIKIKMYIKTS
ncbi:hypothetical protein GGTG_00353 [Gaeumannomyces tritici R3-111a-1]|uniref:Uncharacterized protein n=1 Tax=Gaeumannomyces tritici (strain R3-111a-1) TaxID=644352 RepID=J3NGG3_GAET3|nr:hypothetical protein GGTG_00353 [Gaeumannomyces tritici R3-111a-1]EJT80353.1 hypothetical protein GGTG_00353 [Gaeumannomyces tritici R3-111a-1]